jgi:hypothetical protein
VGHVSQTSSRIIENYQREVEGLKNVLRHAQGTAQAVVAGVPNARPSFVPWVEMPNVWSGTGGAFIGGKRTTFDLLRRVTELEERMRQVEEG